MSAAAVSVEPETQSYWQRLKHNVRTGNLGNAPVIVALGFVVLYFSLTARTASPRSTSPT